MFVKKPNIVCWAFKFMLMFRLAYVIFFLVHILCLQIYSKVHKEILFLSLNKIKFLNHLYFLYSLVDTLEIKTMCYSSFRWCNSITLLQNGCLANFLNSLHKQIKYAIKYIFGQCTKHKNKIIVSNDQTTF